MADASRSPHPPGSNPPGSNPSGWSDVFAALPMAAPPASAWPAIAAQLDQKKKPVRNRAWLALAASLFALTALPVAWMLRDTDRNTGPIATLPATIVRTPITDTPSAIADPVIIAPIIAPIGDDRSAQTPSIAVNTLRPAQTNTARRSADRARRHTAKMPPATGTAQSIAQTPDDADTTLETLYIASAQLETLLTFARDTRVESGPAAALASSYDAELANIDARLAQPGLEVGQQRALWQARVDTLQRSAGFESNLRLLAADGGRLDGALVSID
jgi:hypothetical protein